MIVDAHLHIWKSDPAYPDQTLTTVSPACDIPETLLRDYMEEHGVSRAVLVQPMYPGEDNSLVANAAKAEPDRYKAVCVVNPTMAGAEDRLSHWVEEHGCKGLRLRPVFAPEEACFGNPESYPLWERAAQLGIIINALVKPPHLPALKSVVEKFPQVPVIIDHMAFPNVAKGINGPDFQLFLSLAKFPNVHVKPSGLCYYTQQKYPYTDCHPFIEAAYDTFGPERLIWGSDFPHVLLSTGYRRSLLIPERFYTFLSTAERDLLLGGNASRLYWGE